LEKQNLILIHSFITNRIIYQGIIEFLEDYFNVYFLDLPGSLNGVPALEDNSVESYGEYMTEKIKDFGLDSYWLAGVSFGFLVASRAKLDSSCKGLMAMEPYLGYKELCFSKWRRKMNLFLLNVICGLKIYDFVWHTKYFRKNYMERHRFPDIDCLISNYDAKAYFETAKVILNYDNTHEFHKLPHVCFLNTDDKTLDNIEIGKIFEKNVEDVMFLFFGGEHYPKDLGKSYYEEHVGKENMLKAVEYMRQF